MAKLIKDDLIKKIITASGNKDAALIEHSEVLNGDDYITTDIAGLNIALGGALDGRLNTGTLMIAGPSKHFKTLFALKIASSYMNANEDAIMVFIDSEKGASLKYFSMFGVDTSRVIHLPVLNVEQLKNQQSNILNTLERGQKVIFIVDSIGNLASLKEIEDAINDKTVADMTRAKQLKSWSRIICPIVAQKQFFQIVVNHTYKELGHYPKDIVSGGSGTYYNSNDVWIIGRQQDKETSGDKELLGFTFVIKIDKSRSVKEGSRIPVTVSFEEGIDKYSAIFELAIECGLIENPSQGWYNYRGETDKVRKKDLSSLLERCLEEDEFKKFVIKKYQL